MAYVVWRVLMKKYTKTRLNIQRNQQELLQSPITAQLPLPDVPLNNVAVVDHGDLLNHDDPPPPFLDATIAAVPLDDSGRNGTAARRIESEVVVVVEDNDEEVNQSQSTVSEELERVIAMAARRMDLERAPSQSSQAQQPAQPPPSMTRNETRRSKSKVRSYLRRCKEVITGHHFHQQQQQSQQNQQQEDGKLPMTDEHALRSISSSHEPVIQRPSRGESDQEDCRVAVVAVPERDEEEEDEEVEEGAEERSADNTDEPPTRCDLQLRSLGVVEDYSSVSALVDQYMGHLYPDYDHTRSVLVRQTRDLLLCTYQGDLGRLEEEFLAPAAATITAVKRSCESGQNLAWCKGWPLSIAGAVALHLGTLDESLVRPQDLYLCIRSNNDDESRTTKHVTQFRTQFCVCWYSTEEGRVLFRAVEPESIDGISALGPLSVEEMLAEELPQLLQTLLVGVERVICRLPLDDLSFPSSSNTNNDTHHYQHRSMVSPDNASATNATANSSDSSMISTDEGVLQNAEAESIQRRPSESGLKRRELITKNKMLGTKYALLRAIKSENKSQANNGGGQPEVSVMMDQIVLAEEDRNGAGGFGLGGGLAFPHIDSDEESSDETNKPLGADKVSALPKEVTMPRSIADVPEKHLLAGIYLPGLRDREQTSIIAIDGSKLIDSQLNSCEVATVLLYYTTVPTSPVPFTIHVAVTQDVAAADHLLQLLDDSLLAIYTNIAIKHIIVSGLESSPEDSSTSTPSKKLPKSGIRIIFCTSTDPIGNYISPENVLSCAAATVVGAAGPPPHDQLQWIEYFAILEPLQRQCIATGKKLVTVMGDIRNADIQGVPSRRQLHSQHRALSRALMDADLQSLRRKGPATIARLQERAKIFGPSLPAADGDRNGDHVHIRLAEVGTIFGEVDRAAKRLEYLTEQRRECLREMTRQRALEDEINDVLTWIRSHGESTVTKYMNVSLECSNLIKDHEQEFEKFYFISMKHLAKGRDLHEATLNVEPLRECANSLKQNLDAFSDRLEATRERIEGATRLHHLFGLQLKEDDVLHEMQRLAEKIGKPDLLDRFKQNVATFAMGSSQSRTAVTNTIKLDVKRLFNTGTNMATTNTSHPKLQVKATPSKPLSDCSNVDSYSSWTSSAPRLEQSESPDSGLEARSLQNENGLRNENNFSNLRSSLNNKDHNEEDEEDHSKMADSGLGGCDRCEGADNSKLKRACSCQSFEDATMACIKSNDSDDTDDDDVEGEEDDGCFRRNAKTNDIGMTNMQTNSHLFSHSSSLNMDLEAEVPGIDPKTQKTLLLIMREMIGTERDYVRSLHYIIDNYTKELLREDIPQALRGQRNVIFGNVERIYEFHHQYFLDELERCEKNPLKVGAAFLRHESKFYLYALYNKNKPKSDSLMSEYGTSFFKSKQLELNDKMDLASYLLKPVQRMGKYALLLQQLMKACSAIQGEALQYITEDVEELQKAEEMVRFQLRHGNDLLAQDSLRDCDVNVKEQGRLLRQNEFLVWQGKTGKKSLRQVFLFEELVLFSKARRFPDRKNLDIYIYKNSIKTSDIGLTAHVGDSPTKFEIWFRKRKPDDTWTLQSMSEDIKNAWAEEFSRLLWMQARKNREIRLLEMSSMGIGSKPCLDIRPSQNQINDRSISFSQMAPKFRNSFMSTATTSSETVNKNRRPNSIVSVNSLSSGTSSSSGSCGGRHSNSFSKGQQIDEEQVEQSERAKEKECESVGVKESKLHSRCERKGFNLSHHRSTTLVSQCSMESGIIDDISTTPDEVSEPPSWPMKKLSLKSTENESSETNANQSPNGSNPYINESLAVHL